jgi:hypothetical protein
MEKVKKTIDHDSGVDPMMNLPCPKFSQKILKTVIGEDKAT